MVSTHIGFPTETVIVFVVLAIGAIFIDLFMHRADTVSYTHLTLPTNVSMCRSRWSPYH